jgi:hypothetical protein
MKKFVFTLVIISMGCCKPDLTSVSDFNDGMLILNEGTFTFGNASLDFYKHSKDSLFQNVFSSQNKDAKLGDVGQSMVENDSLIFIVVNNSQKIEVVNKKTLKSIRTITGFGSPRYLHLLDGTRALVTELYNQKVHMIDFTQGTIIKSFESFGWTEKMIQNEGQVWIQVRKLPSATTISGGYMIYDIASDKMTSIKLDYQPISICIANNFLWSIIQKQDKSYELLGHDMTIFDAIPHPIKFAETENPNFLIVKNNALYFAKQNKIFSIDISNPQAELVAQEFISNSDISTIYGLQYSSLRSTFYIFDPKDYTKRGDVFIYDDKGTFTKKIKANVIPSQILEL